MTTKAEHSVQVDVPLSTAYNQWTQFEDFPHFMSGVKEVRQLDDRRLQWTAEIAGVRRQWEASILEQVPDEKIAWAATSGATNAGAVRFQAAGAGSTVVYLTLEYEPEGLVEQAGDKLGFVQRQVRSDLDRFKALVESEGYASGAWRGSVNDNVDVGTPGVEDAVGSHGDSGRAGVSGKAVAAGAAAVAAGVAAVGAVVASSKREEEEEQPRSEAAVVPPPVTVTETVVVEEPVTTVVPPASATEGLDPARVATDLPADPDDSRRSDQR